jgi:D-glycero-alpha-D-manno-heptose-7-phosphate kinase
VTTEPTQPLRVVNAVAPIRICDLGGWTDTWFAGHGRVLNLAVEPTVDVQVTVHPAGALEDRVVLDVEDYGERYAFAPGSALPDRHPLLEAAVEDLGVPDDVSVRIGIHSEAPAGASTGTSAAVTVALVAAPDALTPGRRSAQELAELGHRVEVERLGLQAGIQDQLCSAHGGVCAIEMPAYPQGKVEQVVLGTDLWRELDRRLMLVFLGRTHTSSEVHDRVIARLEASGTECAELSQLRSMAERGHKALVAGDLETFGAVMTANTEAQAGLHPDLVSPDARRVIDVAAAHGALGWKVNGAGGEGGSLTILCDHDMGAKRRLASALAGADALFQHIPTRLSSSGVQVWDSPVGTSRGTRRIR